MGSILQCTAMLTALRDRFPESEIWFVSTSGNLQMLSKFAELNRILVIRDESVFSLVKSLTSTWWKLVRFRSEVYIDLEMYSHFSSLFALFSLAKNRIGFYTRGDDAKLGIFTHMMFFNVNAPISRVYLQMAYLLQPKKPHQKNRKKKKKNYPQTPAPTGKGKNKKRKLIKTQKSTQQNPPPPRSRKPHKKTITP
ncbi:MAG: hypothetical protein IPN49_13990 [Saprospiraceae bacterium]|nr:hypothetical protein [Saprospiraceae bacterium]